MTLAPIAPDEDLAGSAADSAGEGTASQRPASGEPPRAASSWGPPPTALVVAAMASLGAGAIHATAAGVHGDHRQSAIAFAVLTVFQLGWGALALRRSTRWLSLVGAAGNAAALGGWVLAKTSGIGFVDGLEEAEGVQFADGLAAALAAVAVLGALAAVARPVARRAEGWGSSALVGASALAAVGLVLPGMVSAGGHSHAGGDGHTAGGHDHSEMASTVPPAPYDGTLPVDLSGVEGVSAEEQAEAEAVLTRTIQDLPQFADPAVAEQRGYRSIGDSLTGFEHYMKWDLVDDGRVLDPNYPESLVYRVEGDRRILAAAMYMGEPGQPMEEFPGVGGELIQSHIHNDLCFAGEEGAWRVADVAPPPQECRPGTERLGEPAPMIHAWITEHECGPFAALEGVGGGQVAAGETPACDHAHGAQVTGG